VTDEDRAECIPVLLEIQRAGGPKKIVDPLLAEARRLKLVKSQGGLRYTIKGNRLRDEMVGAYPGQPQPTPGDGAVVDATVAGNKLRGRARGKVGDLVRVDHLHSDGKVEPIAVAPEAIEEVDRGTL
jgi:hypothetical protein